jgi:hypothetical protein
VRSVVRLVQECASRRRAADAHTFRLAVAPKDINVITWKQSVFIGMRGAFNHGPADIPENHSSNRARHAKG